MGLYRGDGRGVKTSAYNLNYAKCQKYHPPLTLKYPRDFVEQVLKPETAWMDVLIGQHKSPAASNFLHTCCDLQGSKAEYEENI